MGKFGFLAGLRAEQAFITSHLITTDSIIPNNYFKIYPTLHLSYTANENSELQLNYSHRVNRPEGDELNPFPEYADPFNLRAGNPNLKPEDIHSLEAGYSYKRNRTTFIATLYDRYTYNGMTQITRYINDSVLLTTRENLSNYISARLTPQGKMFPTFFVNMGFRQDLWKRRASLTLAVSDVFNTLRNNEPHLQFNKKQGEGKIRLLKNRLLYLC